MYHQSESLMSPYSSLALTCQAWSISVTSARPLSASQLSSSSVTAIQTVESLSCTANHKSKDSHDIIWGTQDVWASPETSQFQHNFRHTAISHYLFCFSSSQKMLGSEIILVKKEFWYQKIYRYVHTHINAYNIYIHISHITYII